MQKWHKNDIETAESITLSLEERREMRAGLLRVMSRNGIRRFSLSLMVISFRPFYGAVSMAMVMILISGGISYAAESALPGDTLYPVKVGVTERVRSWTAFSYEADGAWQVARAERRLQEASLLAVQGKLDSKKEAEIASRLREHTEEATETIAHLQIDKRIAAAASASSRLESSLRIHEQILTQVAEDRTEMDGPIKGMLAIIRKDVEETTKVRASLEEEIAEDDMEAKSIHVDTTVKKAKEWKKAAGQAEKYISAGSFDGGSQEKAEGLLTMAKKLADEGDIFLAANEQGKAFTSYQKALRIAEAIRTLSETRTDFVINLHLETVIGEEKELVPFLDALKPER
jgi:hypothetical protein